MSAATKRHHFSIPQVKCEACGQAMRLAKIEPSNVEGREIYSYDCECGFTHQHIEFTPSKGIPNAA